jgi:hypothetical protein
MRAAQRRARALDLRMSFRRRPAGAQTAWSITVDGNGYRIAAWSQQLARDLPIVAEGYTALRPNESARNLATSLVARWTAWCVGEEEYTTVSLDGRDRVRWIWPIIDFPERKQRLNPRLLISDELIGRWMTGDLPEEVAIEEFHTAIEALLRHLQKVGRGPSWPTLLGRAKSRGDLSSADARTLTRFNDLHRNRLKHEGSALTAAERKGVKQVLLDVLVITERLLSRERARSGRS